MIAYYPFNSNANDLSGNNNNGTVSGAIPTTDRKGILNRAFLFDGVNDYIEINNSSSLNLSQAISISFWARFNSEANFYMPYVIIDKYGSWGITTRETEVSWTVSTSNGEFSFWSSDFQLNAFYHFVMVYDGSYSRVYANGVLQSTLPATGLLTTTTNNIFIGRHQIHDTDYHFDGALDDIRIYNRALTQQEITALYNE